MHLPINFIDIKIRDSRSQIIVGTHDQHYDGQLLSQFHHPAHHVGIFLCFFFIFLIKRHYYCRDLKQKSVIICHVR